MPGVETGERRVTAGGSDSGETSSLPGDEDEKGVAMLGACRNGWNL